MKHYLVILLTTQSRFLRALTFIFLSSATLFAQDFERHPEAPELNGIVQYILKGDSLDAVKHLIYTGAMFIDGGTQMSLYDALFGPNKSKTFELEHQRYVAEGWLTIGKGDNAAIAIAKTTSKDKPYPRFHSVFFAKTKTGDWVIKYWHTSN